MEDVYGDLTPGRGPLGKVKIKVDLDARQMADLRQLLADIPGATRRVIVRAINDTLRSGRQVIVKGLSDLTTAKSSEIRNRLTIRRATDADPSGLLNMSRARFAARRFKHKERRRKRGWGTSKSGEGVFLQVFKSGETRRYPHAFLAKTEVRGANIFQRTTIGPGSDRRKIAVIPAINLAEIFWKDPALGERTIDRMRAQLDKNLASRADYELAKRQQNAAAVGRS